MKITHKKKSGTVVGYIAPSGGGDTLNLKTADGGAIGFFPDGEVRKKKWNIHEYKPGGLYEGVPITEVYAEDTVTLTGDEFPAGAITFTFGEGDG